MPVVRVNTGTNWELLFSLALSSELVLNWSLWETDITDSYKSLVLLNSVITIAEHIGNLMTSFYRGIYLRKMVSQL